MSTANKAEGSWEPLHPVLKEKGWDDCCPSWDDEESYCLALDLIDDPSPIAEYEHWHKTKMAGLRSKKVFLMQASLIWKSTVPVTDCS